MIPTGLDLDAETIRVLIDDDHRTVREGIKQVLANAPDVTVVAEAPTGPAVLVQVAALMAPGAAGLGLVLLDIALPGIDGLDVLQTLEREHPRLPVLMPSTYPEKQYAVRCIRLGASGYLNKSADPDDRLAASPPGFSAKRGAKVALKRTAGWAVVRDKTLAGGFDASHMLIADAPGHLHGARCQRQADGDASDRKRER